MMMGVVLNEKLKKAHIELVVLQLQEILELNAMIQGNLFQGQAVWKYVETALEVLLNNVKTEMTQMVSSFFPNDFIIHWFYF